MEKSKFEVVDFDGEIDEMVSNENTTSFAQPKVTTYKPTTLSDFAKEVKGGNRKTRRAEAKRIRRAFK